jgi:uncharacterized protein (DUF433 family)
MLSDDIQIYGGRNPWDLPLYSPREAAQYIWMPRRTAYYWLRDNSQKLGISVPNSGRLTFKNLIEIYVINALRQHRVQLKKIRHANNYLRETYKIEHPLADLDISTDRHNVMFKSLGKLINASEGGQIEFEEVIAPYLNRIERDKKQKQLLRLFPFTDQQHSNTRFVVLDPLVQFGRPCIAGTRIRTDIVFERYKAGEAVTTLARDYDLKPPQIEAAISYEQEAA